MYLKVPTTQKKCITKTIPITPFVKNNNKEETISGEGVSKQSEKRDKEEKPKLHNVVELLKNIEVRKI